MLLAGDVGGTKTLLGLFEPIASTTVEARDRRPRALVQHSYATADYPSFAAILAALARDVGSPIAITSAVIGVAGPVIGGSARLTNIPWDVSTADVATALGTPRVELMNDLEAIANSVGVLQADEVAVIQEGTPRPDGNAAVIAAGTGLGQAYLHRHDGRLVPVASEGGHADFAARTDREIEFVKMLRERNGRAEIEQVLSGPGLLNLHRFTHRGGECEMLAGAQDRAARVSQAGMGGRCQQCADALRMFVSAYGAEAGNLALRGMATAGLYVAGGIAPKILPMLRGGLFMDAFLAKSPMDDLIASIPVLVVLNSNAGLVGAAVRAQEIGV